MTTLPGLDASPWEYVARWFEPKARKHDAPGRLAAALDRKTGRSPALDLIDRELVALVDGDDVDALAVFMPPQEGKSQRVARRFPEWLLEHDPALRIAIVSYEMELALRWGRDIKQDIQQSGGELAISIRRDSTAAGRWETPEGGGVYCVGIGGPLTGKPVDVLIVDDPVKDRAAAESDKIRQSAWDWWESVAITRLAPGGKVVLIQTRWHEDDLAGRIMTRPSPLRWKFITIPAVADKPGDPLGRPMGAELQSVRGRKPGYFANLRATMSAYTFAGIYQQSPVAPEGNFFRRATFRYWRPMTPWPDGRARIDCEGQPVTMADAWRFATVDVAASTKTSADYTVISAWAVSVSGDLILLDRRRNRVEMHDHFGMADPLLATWGITTLYVEKQFYSATLVEDARARGYSVTEVIADKDKVTRAIPAAGRLHAGRIWFPAVTSGCPCGNCPDGVWLDEWCDELAGFPSGTHDDQVDTLSYAAKVQVHDWTPPVSPQRPALTDHERAVALAHQSATGGGDLDIMNVPY